MNLSSLFGFPFFSHSSGSTSSYSWSAQTAAGVDRSTILQRPVLRGASHTAETST